MSMSFGLCEAALGSSGNNFINSLWQQAAAEGITVFVSSGDSGAAGCDSSGAPSGTHGRGINGLCSSPYSVCVGGTQFDDTGNPSLYWSSFNSSGTQASAQSYIPEKVWNESGNSGLWSGGGGVSTVYSKPSWQTGTGVPSDNKRDVPDVFPDRRSA
jgi:subtilase family serine protease